VAEIAGLVKTDVLADLATTEAETK